MTDYETSIREDFSDWETMQGLSATTLTADEKEIYANYEKQFGKYSDVESHLSAQASDENTAYAHLKSEAENPKYE